MSLSDDDPSDFEFGILPVIPPGTPLPRKEPRTNAATGGTAAAARAFTAQAVAFYFRAPVKAFFRTRVDYLAYAKAIHPDVQAGRSSWRTTTPGLLAHAVRTYGWRFIPEQVLPPLIANVAVGAVLYTGYLQILGHIYEPSSQSAKVVYPPPPPQAVIAAGFVAGGVQSLVAAPLDAIQTRFEKSDAQRHTTMWRYGRSKLAEIGVRGIFAGWGLSFLKDSFGAGVFFTTFEYMKSQAYYKFVRYYYGGLDMGTVNTLARKSEDPTAPQSKSPTIRPHYALEPGFLMLAGITASIVQQSVLYPLSLIQTLHLERLEDLHEKAKKIYSSQGRGQMLRAYYHAYQETWRQCKLQSREVGGLRRWLYGGFWWSTLRQIPSTSAGLIIFELVRRKYGLTSDTVKINEDGYDILLT